MLLIGQVGQVGQKGQVLLIDHEVQMMHEFHRIRVLMMVQMVHEFGVLECEEVKSLVSQELEVVEMWVV